MQALYIYRVNKRKFLIKNGEEIIAVCSTYKEALNTLESEALCCAEEIYDEYDLVG